MFAIDKQASSGALKASYNDAAAAAAATPTDTRNPITTTSSVLALTYKDGVLMVADTTVSYGRMVRFRGQPRFISLGKKALLCTSGEYSDHQYLQRQLEAVVWEDAVHADFGAGEGLSAKAIATYTSRLLYQRRSNFNPYWLNVVVAGHVGPAKGVYEQQQQQQSHMYLGTTDLLGTFFREQVVATGLGRYFAVTLMRERHRPDMSEEEARALLEECMRILFYRDCAASNEIQFAKVTAEGVTIDEPKKLDSNWHFEAYTKKSIDIDLAGCSW
ncbi:hypothetical protein Esti_001222 [Eimeria stiedai]